MPPLNRPARFLFSALAAVVIALALFFAYHAYFSSSFWSHFWFSFKGNDGRNFLSYDPWRHHKHHPSPPNVTDISSTTVPMQPAQPVSTPFPYLALNNSDSIANLTSDGYVIVVVEGRAHFITNQIGAAISSILPHVENHIKVSGHNWKLRVFVVTEDEDPGGIEAVQNLLFYPHAVRVLGQQNIHIQRLPYNPRDGNTLMYDTRFWRDLIQEEHILYVQRDAGFCPQPELPLSYFLDFAYLGAPWGGTWRMHNVTVYQGNGGLSIRSRRAMVLTSAKYRWTVSGNEDGFYGLATQIARNDGFDFIRIPTREDAQRFSIETAGEIEGWTNHPPHWRPLGFHNPCHKLSVYDGKETALRKARALLKYCPDIAHALIVHGHEGAVCYDPHHPNFFKSKEDAQYVYRELFAGLSEQELLQRGLKDVRRIKEKPGPK